LLILYKLTDNTGFVVWEAQFDSFGRLLAAGNNKIDNPLRFPGQYFDAETGLHYNYFRDYDPELGRYIQSDRLGLFDGPNTYGYAHQNPIMYTDPTGEFVPQLLGFAIGAGLEYLTNPCASASDIILAGGLGALGGGLSKLTLLKHGPKSLTRVTGKEWSHSISRKTLKKYTNTNSSVYKFMNKRGGYNGSWTSPKRHYMHDPSRFPKGWRDMGDRLPAPLRALDRIPDWAKGAVVSGAAVSAIAGSECGCN
jgi:RHS repeat-associated protein